MQNKAPEDATSPGPGPGSELEIAPGEGKPRFRPRESFWPYVDLPERPTEEEMSRLDPDLRTALFGSPPLPFSVTVVFPAFDGPAYAEALEIARSSEEYREAGPDGERLHHARFRPSDAGRLRDLWRLVGSLDAAGVLVDDRPVPYARELWLPLFWFLVRRK